MDHGTQISKVEVWTMADGGRGCWPIRADEPIVFMVDVTTMGHSTGEFTGSARSHRFLLNSRECATVPYLARQLSVLQKLD